MLEIPARKPSRYVCATQDLKALPGAVGNCLRVLEASRYVQSFIQLINQSIKSFIQIKKHTTIFRLNYLFIYHLGLSRNIEHF